MDLDKLINDRINQKTNSIRITRQAENKEEAIKKEYSKWAVQYQIQYPDDGFVLLDKANVEIKENGEITGMENAVKELIKRSPYLCDAPEEHQTRERPRQIGG